MKIVIQAGGMGTRLREITGDRIPKPLTKLGGKTILEWQFEQLKRYGYTDIWLIVGHLGEMIEAYYGDGRREGLKISYVYEKKPLGSAGALYFLKDEIGEQDFLLLFGDIIFNIDIERMKKFHKHKAGIATLLVHPNSHPYDSDLVVLDGESRVQGFIPKNKECGTWYHNCVNAGIYILSGKMLKAVDNSKYLDLERDLLRKMLFRGEKIYGYRSLEYVKDAGIAERFYSVEKDLEREIPEKKSLRQKQKCIFLDRDGTVNQFKGLLFAERDMELIKGAAEGIRQINDSGYLVIIVTNQPVVARGRCSIQELDEIHKKLETLLGRQGAYLDDIIYCPHHPDAGYPEENPIYKVKCDCRKPQIGMINTMQKKYNIDLSASYMVGDTTVDIMTGINAGMHTVLLDTGEGGRDGKYNVKPEFSAKNLQEAVQIILDGDIEWKAKGRKDYE